MVVRDIGEYLAVRLEPPVDLYGDERDNWTAFKPLLRQVFQRARQVPQKGLPNDCLSEEDYRSYVEGARMFVKRVHSALGSDREVQAQLLELVESLSKLDACVLKADFPYIVED